MLIPRVISDLRTPSERFYGAAVAGEGLPQEDRMDFLEEAGRTFDKDKRAILGRNLAVGGLSGGVLSLALGANPNIAERSFNLVDRVASNILEGKARNRLVDVFNQNSAELLKSAPDSNVSPISVATRLPLLEVQHLSPDDPRKLEILRSVRDLNENVGPQTRRAAARDLYKSLIGSGPDPLVTGDMSRIDQILGGYKAGVETSLPAPKTLLSTDSEALRRALTGEPAGSARGWERASDMVQKTLGSDPTSRVGRARTNFLTSAKRLQDYNTVKEGVFHPALGKLRSLQAAITPRQRRLGALGLMGAGAALAGAKTHRKLKAADKLLRSSKEDQRDFLTSTVRLPGVGVDLMSEAPSRVTADSISGRIAEPVVNLMEILSQ